MLKSLKYDMSKFQRFALHFGLFLCTGINALPFPDSSFLFSRSTSKSAPTTCCTTAPTANSPFNRPHWRKTRRSQESRRQIWPDYSSTSSWYSSCVSCPEWSSVSRRSFSLIRLISVTCRERRLMALPCMWGFVSGGHRNIHIIESYFRTRIHASQVQL